MENTYQLKEEKSDLDLKFYFISSGQRNIVKVVQYSFVRELGGRRVYNLGFGDYNLENDEIIDNVITGNGDAFKVFYTVLNTIPIFFEYFKKEALLVQGSDGRPDFIETCRKTCIKNCKDGCKKYNRRIKIYIGFIEKNYEKLVINYQFWGIFQNLFQESVLEPYQRGKNYHSILLLLKKT